MQFIRYFVVRLIFALAIPILATAPVQAIPFTFQHTDTISSIIGSPGLSVGQSANITVTLDNGGTTNVSQTWTAAHLLSVTFDFNNGGLVTTFNSPWQTGLSSTSGAFTTDAAGLLTTANPFWGDNNIFSNFTSTGIHTNLNWFLAGAGAVYVAFVPDSFSISLTNVSLIRQTSGWTQTASAPEPATLAIFGLGLAGLGLMRRRRKAV